jgi:hypothetical protein
MIVGGRRSSSGPATDRTADVAEADRWNRFAVTLILSGPGHTAVHRMAEFAIDGVRAVHNAYHAEDIDLVVTVTGPAGLTTAVPAFYRDDEEATGWRVRFTSPLSGRWQLVAADGVDLSPPHVLQVETDPAAHGFVRVQGGGFRFDSGEPFLPMGPDLHLPPTVGAPRVLEDYGRWFAELAANGATATRLSLEPAAAWAERAGMLDRIFDLAADHGIVIMLTLLDRRAFDAPRASASIAARLRYAGARWAAHPALWCWEWWDATTWTPEDDEPLAEWIRLMTPALRAADPYSHPVAASYGEGETSLWELEELDFACFHPSSAGPPAEVLPALAGLERKRARGRPVVLGDFPAQHQGLWAGIFAGFASPGHVGGHESLRRYRGLSAFLAGQRPAALTPTVAAATEGLTALALTSPTQVLAWVCGPSTAEGVVTLGGLADGDYTATWCSTADGSAVREDRVVAVGGTVRLAVPPLADDIAVRLE